MLLSATALDIARTQIGVHEQGGNNSVATGKQFGRWTVGVRDLFRLPKTAWWCICSCGTDRSVQAQALREGKSRSCGCDPGRYEKRRLQMTMEAGHAGKTVFLGDYKKSARIKGIPWDLTDHEALRLSQLNCEYCGVTPSHKRYGSRKAEHRAFVHNGIDRVDNSLGYVEGNVVPCCRTCNISKRATPVDEWLDWVDRVASNIRRKRESRS